MILKGSKRGGAIDLARHLLKSENEHVELHQIRGFVSDTLPDALKEAQAISLGTRCQKFLFHVSLSPPELENVPVEVFEAAIERIEQRLGLTGQPRAIVFHEKEGRRHAHAVWSRIKLQTMTAIDLPHFKLKLMDISRDLFLEHQWRMPAGMIDPAMRSPLSFDMKEWFKAKRLGKDPRDVKAALQQCWSSSDSERALKSSLEQCGYFLARGDRRGVVAIDTRGEIYNLARWLGVRSKDVFYRVDAQTLPSVELQMQRIAVLVKTKIESFAGRIAEDFSKASQVSEAKRHAMKERHVDARAQLAHAHQERTASEAKARSEKFRKGVLGLWDRLTGLHGKIRRQNETEIEAAVVRDRREKQDLIQAQLEERQALQAEIRHARRLHVHRTTRLLRGQVQHLQVGADQRRPKERSSRTLDV